MKRTKAHKPRYTFKYDVGEYGQFYRDGTPISSATAASAWNRGETGEWDSDALIAVTHYAIFGHLRPTLGKDENQHDDPTDKRP